jgi:hypothetical protein
MATTTLGLSIANEESPLPVLLPAIARPLYDLEEHLAALCDTELMVPAELEQEYALELQATLTATIAKRDRVGQALAFLEEQGQFARCEAARLQQRAQFYERALDKLKGYVVRTIESLGTDAKGKRKRLEGKITSLWLHGCDKSVEVTDEAAVPSKYKRLTITLPADTWELMCDSLDLDLRDKVLAEVKSPMLEVSRSMVKVDLKADVAVPGAKLTGGTYLVRE